MHAHKLRIAFDLFRSCQDCLHGTALQFFAFFFNPFLGWAGLTTEVLSMTSHRGPIQSFGPLHEFPCACIKTREPF